MTDDHSPRLSPNVLAALAYLVMPISSVAVYLLNPKDRFVRFHTVQSGLLGCAVFAVQMLLIATIVGIIITPVVWIASVVVWALMLYKSYQGEEYELPYLGPLAKKHA